MLTVRRQEAGVWRVLRNGEPTKLVLVKGEPPKYRMPQMWAIAVVLPIDADGQELFDFLCDDQKGRHAALETVRRILEACGT